MRTIARHLRITGRVQGVAFRAWTRGMAEHLGLDGWVRNEVGGAVEAVIAGPEAAVEQLITACWEGPGAARVTDVQITPAQPPEKRGFSIVR